MVKEIDHARMRVRAMSEVECTACDWVGFHALAQIIMVPDAAFSFTEQHAQVAEIIRLSGHVEVRAGRRPTVPSYGLLVSPVIPVRSSVVCHCKIIRKSAPRDCTSWASAAAIYWSNNAAVALRGRLAL